MVDRPLFLDRFELRRELGRGGQGVVYLAHDPRLSRDVAVKVLDGGRSVDELWFREASALSRLTEDGVCALYDAAVEDGTPFLVMQYVEGRPLQEWLREGPAGTRSWEESARMLETLARIVDRLHRRGVVHRDLKPSNVIVTGRGQPVIVDFGLASIAGSTGSLKGAIAGSPAYMAPEQVHPVRGKIGPHTDVWALGVILFRCLTGRLPFPGGSYSKLAIEILTDEPVYPEREVPPPLEAVTRKALQKEPFDRYASALEFAEDLARALRGDPVQASRPGWLRSSANWIRRHPKPCLAALALSSTVALACGALRGYALELERIAAEDVRRSDRLLLPHLLAQVDRELWPRLPRGVAAMDPWLEQAEALRGRLSGPSALAHASDSGAQHELRAALTQLSDAIEVVQGRRREALEIGAETVERALDAWTEAAAATASMPAYAGLNLVPQPGLVPLGRDPSSGLLEFGHPQTGAVPERRTDGTLAVDGATCVVFVLIPGGTFWMGAARPDAGHPLGSACVDPDARTEEGPARRVALAPYFISKYELTLAQAERAFGLTSPLLLLNAPVEPDIGPEHPVSRATWTAAERSLMQLGLTLPTEAQWEYAARAGTSSPWWTGWDAQSTAGAANLADLSFDRWMSFGQVGPDKRTRFGRERLEFDDGHAQLAPVGRFAANPFGLHDVHGNVRELTLDNYGPYDLPLRAGDGLRLTAPIPVHVARGGASASSPWDARVTARWQTPPEFKGCGVRPARAVDGLVP